tara:strand:- start:1203 stop:1358 length:156 start_codon:yes stop_codon:yes gene_type:complete
MQPLKLVKKIEYETYYVFCPHCEETITGLTDDSSELQVCPNWECKKEFLIK